MIIGRRANEVGLYFLGREQELARLSGLSTGDVLLVTGPGGAGKTHLIAKHAATSESLWIGFAAAKSRSDVLSLVAAKLRVAGDVSSPESLAVAIDAYEPDVVVFDNLEQLEPDALALLASIVAAVNCAVVGTSRRPLGSPFAETLSLGPLSVEHAAQLLCQRAHWNPELFGDVREDSDTVRSICMKLERLPLVVELAAGALRFMTAEQLEADLDRELSVASLEAGAVRHRTLADSVRWSVNLLSPYGRSVLVAASAFAGGFTLRQIEQVVDLGPAQVRAALGEIVDASLAHYEQSAEERRLRVLEPTRQQLEAMFPDEFSTACAAQARLFTQLAGEHAARVRGPDEGAAMSWIAAERDNLRAAWETLETTGSAEFVALAVALAEPLRRLGPRDLIQRSLATAEDAARSLGDLESATRLRVRRAHLLNAGGRDDEVAQLLDELDSGEVPDDVAAESLMIRALLPRLGVTLPAEERLAWLEEAERKGGADPWLKTCARGMQATALLALDREDDAYNRVRAALSDAEQIGSPSLLVRLRLQLARMQGRADGSAASVYLVEQAQREAIAAREVSFELEAMFNRAAIVYDTGDHEAALEIYEQTLRRARQTANVVIVDAAMVGAAAIRLMHGDFDGVIELIDGPHERMTVQFFGAVATGIAVAGRGALGRAKPDDPLFDEVADQLAALGRRNAREFAEVFRTYAMIGTAESGEEMAAARRAAQQLAAIEDDREIEILARGAVRFATQRMPEGPRVDVGEDMSWFQVDARERTDISTRHVLRRLLGRLVEHHLSGAEDGVELHDMVEAGWPDEIIDPDAAASRVYTSIRYLRKLGLKDVLTRDEIGYQFEPTTFVRKMKSPDPQP